MSITSSTLLTEHCGTFEPQDSWKFGKNLQNSQEYKLGTPSHTILFNKGRYFETSISNKEILAEVSNLTNIPIKHNNMIVGNWKQMEDFVIAMNILGIYVIINIDWI